MKRILSFLLTVSLLAALPGCAKQPETAQTGPVGKGNVTVLDAGGETLIRLQSTAPLTGDSRRAYLEIVLVETAQVLAEQEQLPAQQVLDTLFDRELTIHTAFDGRVMDAITQADGIAGTELDLGCAITDQKGNLLAAYSTGEDTNFATEKTAPYSAFKPLSVYLPAIASGNVDWVTRYEDSPYKQLPGSGGALEDWPQNSSGSYSMAQEPVYVALRRSLNTVAVKCLARVGVSNSISFLQDNFGIPLTQEAQVAEKMGEEEVIGNIAMGYLETGVSPVDMAGYYQVFGTGGVYVAPKAVTKLEDGSGQLLYQRQYDSKQVTTPAAADVMNRLLQQVVGGDGTGAGARIPQVQVAGKTGTGDQNSGNWFVGLVPGYCCALWHGKAESNIADRLFALVMEPVFAGSRQNGEFAAHDIVHEALCCAESGMLLGDGCTVMERAYFITDYKGYPCNIHK